MTTSHTSAVCYRRRTDLLETVLDSELLLLDTQSMNVIGLNPTCSAIWRQLGDARTVMEIVKVLLVEFEVDSARCRTEVERVLQNLAANGLVVQEAV
ncbi:putative PqqD family protein [Gammaproteobacteria bacterium]